MSQSYRHVSVMAVKINSVQIKLVKHVQKEAINLLKVKGYLLYSGYFHHGIGLLLIELLSTVVYYAVKDIEQLGA